MSLYAIILENYLKGSILLESISLVGVATSAHRHVGHFAKCALYESTKVTFLSGNFKCPITVMSSDWLTSSDLIPAISQLPIKVAGIVDCAYGTR